VNKKISVTTDNSALYDFLKFALPDGVQIIPDGLTENRISGQIPLPFELNINIRVIVDLATIDKYVLAAWLINRIKVLKGKHIININRQQIPVNDPEALELLIKEVE
jgi:hypothetical protein